MMQGVAMRTLRSSALTLGLLAGSAIVVAGCHTGECFHGTITVAADVAPDAGAPIIMLWYEDGMEGAEWHGWPGTPEPLAPEDAVTYRPGDASYGYKLCEPCPTCSAGGQRIGAFIDLNGNSNLDYGEPFGLVTGTLQHDVLGSSHNDFVIDQILTP